MLKILFFFFFHFTCLFGVSQTIVGKIQNTVGEPLSLVNVMIKDVQDSTLISEYVITKKTGEYKFTLQKRYPKIIIEATANSYFSEKFVIENPKREETYIHNFILQKDEINHLKEVVIKAEKKAFVIKEDTVKYNVSAYKDGSERKIQDIIKKLPGVEVNEKSGEIKYKGKSVETVTLEGDNLFGSNYSIGTKNINVNMVEQVQAIENYSENPLLKGIENGDKVSLNLKLKKGKVDLSGNIDTGNGVNANRNSVFDNSASVIEVAKNVKSFGIVSYNNVGINNTPFDYFTYSINPEQYKESSFTTKKMIPETVFSTALDDSRTNSNSAWFGNYNSIFKIGKRISIKSNLFYINDVITSNQFLESNILINNQSFITSDNHLIEKKPTQYRGDIEVKVNASKKSLLEYKFKISEEYIKTTDAIFQNNISNYESNLESKNFFLKQSLLFTQKISDKKALQITFNQSTNFIPQNLIIDPSIYNSQNYTYDKEYSNFRKNYLGFESVLLGKTNRMKYTFSIGGFLDNNPFNSYLESHNINSEIFVTSYHNDLSYKKSAVYTLESSTFIYGRWKISPSYSLKYFYQNIENNLQNNNLYDFKIIFEPDLSIKYEIDNVSSILGKISYNEKSNTEEHLFGNSILINNRVSESNIPSLSFQKSILFASYYAINNLYKQFQLNLGVNYSQNKGDFFSNINVTENTTQINYFYLPENYKTLNFNFLIEKYIDIIESTIKLKSNYSISDYKNIVNNSVLRNNTNQNFNSELCIRTAFDIKINFENIFKYYNNTTKNELNSFNNSSLNNSFKIKIKPNKKWLAVLSSDYYLPNAKNNNDNYLFLDASVKYTPKSKLFDFSFIAKNLLNKDNFTQIQTTDYATNIYKSNLISRYVMFNIRYNF